MARVLSDPDASCNAERSTVSKSDRIPASESRLANLESECANIGSLRSHELRCAKICYQWYRRPSREVARCALAKGDLVPRTADNDSHHPAMEARFLRCVGIG